MFIFSNKYVLCVCIVCGITSDSEVSDSGWGALKNVVDFRVVRSNQATIAVTVQALGTKLLGKGVDIFQVFKVLTFAMQIYLVTVTNRR